MSADPEHHLAQLEQQTWLLTGAAGRIATSLRPELARRVGALRLLDLTAVEPEHDGEQPVVADVRDRAAITDIAARTDGILHLAGLSDEADFPELAEANILGTFHMLEAARRAQVTRFVYASSNRVTGFYPIGATVTPEMPVRPDGLYGASKGAAEALTRMYSDKFGLSVVAMRIGSFETAPQDERHLSTWLSPADCLRAVLAAMTAPDVNHAIFYAVTRNTRRWWDLAPGHALGFHPRDDAERYAARLGRLDALGLGGPQGGTYASPAFTLQYLSPDEASRPPRS